MNIPNCTSFLATKADLDARVSALRATRAFDIEQDKETLTVTHKKSSTCVMMALSKGDGQPWITRMTRNLFE